VGDIAEGLIEFLQATAPSWATKLTMERLAFVRKLSEAQAEVARLRAALEYASEMASWHTDDEAREDDETPKDMAAHISGLIRQRCKSALSAQQEVGRGRVEDAKSEALT